LPQLTPGYFWRSHEGVEAFLGYAGKSEKRLQATEQIGSLGRSKGNDDRDKRVNKSDSPFVAFSRKSKFIFEFFENVV
jgi:hypothetical protein